MYNIIIPVLMVFIYLIYLEKKNINEHFQNTDVTILDSPKPPDNKRLKPKFSIELVELNPMFSDRKFVIQDQLNEDGSIKKGVLTNVENTDWKEDFTKKLCQGCSCFNPKVYYRKRKTSPSISPSYKDSPSPSYKDSPSPSYKDSPSPSYKDSPSPSYKDSPSPSIENFSNISPNPSPTSSSSPSVSISDKDKIIDYKNITSSYKTDYENKLVMEKRRNCGFILFRV